MYDEFEKEIAHLQSATSILRSQFGTNGAKTLHETVSIRSMGVAHPATTRPPDYSKTCAEEARTIAEGMSNPTARFMMEKVAESYDLIAKHKQQIAKPIFAGN